MPTSDEKTLPETLIYFDYHSKKKLNLFFCANLGLGTHIALWRADNMMASSSRCFSSLGIKERAVGDLKAMNALRAIKLIKFESLKQKTLQLTSSKIDKGSSLGI